MFYTNTFTITRSLIGLLNTDQQPQKQLVVWPQKSTQYKDNRVWIVLWQAHVKPLLAKTRHH